MLVSERLRVLRARSHMTGKILKRYVCETIRCSLHNRPSRSTQMWRKMLKAVVLIAMYSLFGFVEGSAQGTSCSGQRSSVEQTSLAEDAWLPPNNNAFPVPVSQLGLPRFINCLNITINMDTPLRYAVHHRRLKLPVELTDLVHDDEVDRMEECDHAVTGSSTIMDHIVFSTYQGFSENRSLEMAVDDSDEVTTNYEPGMVVAEDAAQLALPILNTTGSLIDEGFTVRHPA